MVSKKFVSISGVSTKEQLKGIYKIYKELDFDFSIAIGYQVSNKSINQGTQNPRQPKFIDLGNLSRETFEYGFIPAVHYYTKDDKSTLSDLEKIVEIGVDPSLSLLQFNTLPLSVETLRRVKNIGFRIIFKVAVSNKQSLQGGYAVWKGEGVQDVQDGEVNPLVNQVQERKKVIDYVMFDPSHGTNLDLDLDESGLAVKFGKEVILRGELNNLGLIYAGGIKPSNVMQVTKSLLSFFPQDRISIDIESGVMSNGIFNLNLVRDYLTKFKKATS